MIVFVVSGISFFPQFTEFTKATNAEGMSKHRLTPYTAYLNISTAAKTTFLVPVGPATLILD